MNALATSVLADVAAIEPAAPSIVEQRESILRARARRLELLRKKPSMWVGVMEYYRAGHIADMINDWGLTCDPRNANLSVPVYMPFTLDPRQREWIDFTWKNWRDGEYGGTEKSRDVGCSWLAVGFEICLCVLFDDVACGLGSYKSDKVDLIGDMGSLFEKARTFASSLPRELRGGFDLSSTSFTRRMLFPETGSAIVGEIGDEIGRGGRTSIYIVDETAYLEHGAIVDAALSKNTNCRQDISSVKGMANSFAERMHNGRARKFTFHWRDNPRFSQKDYDKFLDDWGSVITAQELDINYQASVENVLIESQWVQAAIDAHVKLGITPTGVKSGALDIADQGIDKNAYAGRYGILLKCCEQWSGKGSDPFASVERAFLISDMNAITEFRYDADGVGADGSGASRKINDAREERHIKRIRVTAFRGSAKVIEPKREMVSGRKNEDMFENLKAQSWWALRTRFVKTYRWIVEGKPCDPSDIISINSSIPELARLSRELSQPVHGMSKSGKMLIEKQPSGTQSPNLADAIMMVFAQLHTPMIINPSLVDDED